MVNAARKLGINIFTFVKRASISPEDFALHMGYSINDVHKIFEGKVFLSPVEIGRIAEVIGTTKRELMTYEAENMIPELQYMKEFKDPKSLDKILDLMDEYVECQEVI